jgi:DNA-binding NarL/FixJ family response regulator
MLINDKAKLNSNVIENHVDLKKAAIICESPTLVNGIYHLVKNDLVGIEIIFTGNWDDYKRSNINLKDSFIILSTVKINEGEVLSQISHFYEMEIPVLLMHDSNLDDSLTEILKIAPCVIVESNCSLDVLCTAFLEIIERNFTWKSNQIRKVIASNGGKRNLLSPREKESLTLYASGLTLREVASKLELSPNSVGKFISRGKDKLNKSGASVNSKTSIYLELQKRNLIR